MGGYECPLSQMMCDMNMISIVREGVIVKPRRPSNQILYIIFPTPYVLNSCEETVGYVCIVSHFSKLGRSGLLKSFLVGDKEQPFLQHIQYLTSPSHHQLKYWSISSGIYGHQQQKSYLIWFGASSHAAKVPMHSLRDVVPPPPWLYHRGNERNKGVRREIRNWT